MARRFGQAWGTAVVATNDTCCTVVPYFKVHPGKLAEFKSVCEQLVAKASLEPKCLYYGFTFNGDEAHCREGYRDAEGVLFHFENVSDLRDDMRSLADTTRFEIHGPEPELAKLQTPLAGVSVQFFTLDCGFRRV